MVTHLRRYLPHALGATAGAVLVAGIGQLYALTGGGCAILCRPPIAAAYGAVMGILLVTSMRPR